MVRILHCRPILEQCSSLELVEISGDDDSIEKITSGSTAIAGACKIDLVRVSRGRALGFVSTNKCIACRTFLESDCFIKSARSISEDIIEYVIITPGFDEFKDILKKIAAMNLELDVKKIAEIRRTSILTPKQERVLRVALEAGYFDYPRKARLSKLAETAGVSKPSVLEILRRAERKALEAFVAGLP
jgi:hypothetical protein